MYIHNLLLGIDLLASTLTGGLPGETLSGRAGMAQARGEWHGKFLAPIFNFIMRNPNHCFLAIAGDMARAQAVIADDERPV
jgi:hypothetical protein